MTLFPQFALLPLELQREIWQKVLDDEPEPAVHIFRWDEAEHHWHLPGLVDSDTAPLMHVCREARSMARRQLRFRHVLADGTCLGACRAFRPDRDAIYVSARDWSLFFFDGFLNPWRAQAAALQHLALDARVVGAEAGVRDFARYLDRFGGLRTVSVVFSEEGWVPRDHVPTGAMQYRLVDCQGGQTVWNAPAGEVKRRDMDPWEVTEGFEKVLRRLEEQHAFVEEEEEEGEEGATSPVDTGIRFKVIPQNIVPKGRRHAYSGKGEGWFGQIVNGVRGLLS